MEGSTLKCANSPLWPSYMAGERRTKFAKAYRMKLRCYWGFFGENVRNMGTYWELIEDMMGTHWELEGNMLGTKKK